MTWISVPPPSIGSSSQFVTLGPVRDIDAGIDFAVFLTQTGSFAVSSNCPVFISSATITEP